MPESRRRAPGNGYPADWRRINLWMPQTLYDRLDAATDRAGLSAFVREAVEEKLDRAAAIESAELVAEYAELSRRHRARIAADGGASPG